MQTNRYTYTYNELDITWNDLTSISPNETKGLDDFPDLVNEVMAAAAASVEAVGGYRILPLTDITKDSLLIENQVFETGTIIAKPLQKATQVAVFACTAGPAIRALYDSYRAAGDPLKAFIADTLGTVIVEKAMDRVQTALEAEVSQRGWCITNRYSPGYCGWHVREQQQLWTLLPGGFCGISLTSSSLMLPEKSVSGIIGLGSDVRKVGYACRHCELEDCLYRRKRIV